jgi:F-type H+-transporting ATPase subunit gamma
MAGLKELKRRLESVKNTKKITYAMKLVSAAKLKKAQDAVTRSNEFGTALRGVLATLAASQEKGGRLHPLMEAREVRNVRVIVVGGSRGLAGGYNANVNRRVEQAARELRDRYIDASISFSVIGKKPAEFFRRSKMPYVVSYEDLPDEALRWPIEELCRSVETEFVEGKIDEVFILYTRFKSALSVSVEVERILPLEVGEQDHVEELTPQPKVLFEPSPEQVFEALVPRIFRSLVRGACLNAKASEHGSRMTAMDAATKNAGDLIDRLQLHYNKLRQTGITSELLDIVGGAEALG